MKTIAIIAPSASGKTALSLKLAKQTNSIILSLDSLAIYKDIDIVSAKPTKDEMGDIVHFGINEIYPNDSFNAVKFITLFKNAKQYAKKHNKNLIIVGGSSFYLKVLIDGISNTPIILPQTKLWVEQKLRDLQKAYEFMVGLDKNYMQNIASNDKYRISKALEIYKQTSQIPTIYFQNNKPKPIVKDIKIFSIDYSVEILRKRIALRTANMLKNGLIDEIIYLEKKYTREPNCMNSIGISETFDFLDGKLTKDELEKIITINTAKLAKRQRTFNTSAFRNMIKGDIVSLENEILKFLKVSD
jgi:tRNA dimethylallyltransferase